MRALTEGSLVAVVGENHAVMSQSLRFAEAVRVLARVSRAHGLTTPTFRSAPGGGHDRTIRRRPTVVIVAVCIDRDFNVVAADTIEGILVANNVAPDARPPIRAAMREALAAVGLVDRDAVPKEGVEPSRR